MRALIVFSLVAACGGSARAPAPVSNQGSAPTKVDPLADLEIESYVPRDMIRVSRDRDGNIRVTAPERADVYLDGVLMGHVPLVIVAPSPGRHQLKIELAGY